MKVEVSVAIVLAAAGLLLFLGRSKTGCGRRPSVSSVPPMHTTHALLVQAWAPGAQGRFLTARLRVRRPALVTRAEIA